MTQDIILHMQEISKAFPGVQALDRVDLSVARGTVHALVGENGAGKSTLMKVLTGVYHADSGQITFRGQPVAIPSPRAAQALGIAIIHQELALLPAMTVGENIFLGREPTSRFGTVDRTTLYAQTQELLERLGIDLDPYTLTGNLSVAQQQMVEIAKALSLNADLLVMDEPTSTLTERETSVLFDLIGELKQQDVTIIYISHRMEEIFAITDAVTVMRDGQHIATRDTETLTMEDIVQLMVGRPLHDSYPPSSSGRQQVVLEVRNLHQGSRLRNINIQLYAGEILGLSGLVGSGRTDLARAIFGIDAVDGGEIILEGQPVHIRSPHDAITLGLGFVPEDRKQQALFLQMSVARNVTIARLDELAPAGFISFRRSRREVDEFIEELDIRTPSTGQLVRNLSGGNQQKVVIARWLARQPKVLILDEPTRGIDVGAKAEVHSLMRELAEQGIAILMISSDLPEILGISDRILVMREGMIVAEFDRSQATQSDIMGYATGAQQGQAILQEATT